MLKKDETELPRLFVFDQNLLLFIEYIRDGSAAEIDHLDNLITKKATQSGDVCSMQFAEFVHKVAINLWGNP